MSAARPATLEANWSILDATEQKTAQLLLDIDQGHLFEHWPAPGSHDAQKKAFLAHALALDGRYPGGLKKYAENARQLLDESRQGVNPYAGWVPQVPNGERLQPGTPESDDFEALGMQQAGDVAFVLVAGGLGERLGYNGIKLDLPSETTTGKTYLELYVKNIQALQERARAATGRKDIILPLMIMTSDDTHARTVALLNDNQNFGAAEGQITILKQEKLPAMFDNQAHFALDAKNPYEISTKPHGHGDVHMLLFQSGLAKKWVSQGKKWVVFFQDTNGLVFRAIPAALGVSAKKNFDVNSLTVARKAGEAVGAICQLVHKDGRNMTLNVEYNQLDPLLRSTVNPNGDIADASGFSPFPGNINVLVFAAQSYSQVLDRTSGLIPEFVNPKYADATKTKFQSPTRLESMMQDYPKLLDPSARVGFTQCERWMCFSAVKNNVADAAEKFKKTGVAESASSGENDLYYYARRVLGESGKANIDVEGKEQVFANIPTKIGARVVLEPSFGTTQAEILSKFKGGKDSVSISANSTLVLDGPDVTIGRLELDGALIVRAVPGAKVHIDGLKVHNKGWHFEAIDTKDPQVPEKYRIRGYVLKKEDQRELVFDKPGQYTVQA